MPRLSVYYVRASLIHLVAGFTLGGIMLVNKGLMLSPAVWTLLPMHIEFDLIGWLVQLAMGVAFWILPRFSKGSLRGNEGLSWIAFFLINSGIILVALDAIAHLGWPMLAGRTMELLAVTLFAAGNWRRIKAHGVA